MTDFLRKTISLTVGCLAGLIISIYGNNHRETSTMTVCYDAGMFREYSENTETVPEIIQVQEAETDMDTELPQEDFYDDLGDELYCDSLELLALCVEAEAANQGLIGKKYVVDVVLNRVDDPDFPDNITDVILQRNQFSVVTDERIWTVEPTEETFQAVREELEQRTNYDVLYFTSEGYIKYGTDWKKIGDHYFSTK